ncbi:hypothetical protein TraAM80_05511 [Trypanosoma rangeli]|uniref:Uncharacterized protein n=1 Tax=Trypanosoma rangeli TaxID=5698 RepID=A0A422NEH1_TRYRA|nr:uncharacterized protein TraAM80_05511 [Trypanosoma rangeli]RNF03857.1 hypothetical protein TraAM80_05511 [Trypanosoma rangeli]|eukprot:RNF03857.1 hypothetical protein TraAM80_05511 [Trypanosoma rangeli]
MHVRVNGGHYCTTTGMLEVKRRFGSGSVLVNYDKERPCIAPVDASGRFLVRDGCSYDVYSLQMGDARRMAAFASDRETRLSQRDTLASQEALQQQKRKRSYGSSPKKTRRKGNYVCFVQSFLRGFLSVSFADAAKEWRLFPEELKRTAHVDVLLERVRAKGVYEPSVS